MALLHVDYHSFVLGMDMQMDVILPEATRGQIGMRGVRSAGRCRTLYLLHGMSDDHTIWQRRTSVERYVAELGIAVVMPCTYLGWYTDCHAGPAYYTAIAEELPRICRQLFPMLSDRREDTWVAGLSMGGYGALKLALRASGTFSRAAMLSAAADPAEFGQANPMGGYWEDVFGPLDRLSGGFDDLFAAAEECPVRPPVYMWCGTEDTLFPQSVRVREHLRALGYPVTWTQGPGDHSWGYWDEQLRSVLRWLTEEEAN